MFLSGGFEHMIMPVFSRYLSTLYFAKERSNLVYNEKYLQSLPHPFAVQFWAGVPIAVDRNKRNWYQNHSQLKPIWLDSLQATSVCFVLNFMAK